MSDTTLPDIVPGLIVQYRVDAPGLDGLAGQVREVSGVTPNFVKMAEPGRHGVAHEVRLSRFWDTYEPHTPEGETASNDPLADAAAKDLNRTYVRTTALLAGVTAPGFYTVGADEAGRLRVESFTAATTLEADGPEEDRPGMWVVSSVEADNFSNILVQSVHDDELDAYHAVDFSWTRPTVTFVEYGAPVQDVIRETHSL